MAAPSQTFVLSSSHRALHYPLLCSCKFVAALGIGLFSGAVFPLAMHYTPPVSPAAEADDAGVTEYRKSLDKPLFFIGTVAAWGFGLAYALAPARLRHPYLVYAAVLSTVATYKWGRISFPPAPIKTLKSPSSSSLGQDDEKNSVADDDAGSSIERQLPKEKSELNINAGQNTSQNRSNDEQSRLETLGNDLRIISITSLSAFVFSMIGTVFHH